MEVKKIQGSGRFKRDLENKTVKIWGWIRFICEGKEGVMDESQVPNLHNPVDNEWCHSPNKEH